MASASCALHRMIQHTSEGGKNNSNSARETFGSIRKQHSEIYMLWRKICVVFEPKAYAAYFH